MELVIGKNEVKLDIRDVTRLEGDRIQRKGSTAISSIPAKPKIDILVGVDDISKVDKLYSKNYKDLIEPFVKSIFTKRIN
ncbi:GrpB family protein [Psychrobacillus sp. BM2]|uniref:GrpB family protein n=1 Tax=Psychrobacillus sp. BM2 TaxID=3400421 RepID=UPI003B02E4DD